MITRQLKNWVSPSGNRCDATLTVDGGGDRVAITFSWHTPPSAEDRDFHYEVLSEALALTDDALAHRRETHDVCLDLWAEGLIVPVETLATGERRWVAREQLASWVARKDKNQWDVTIAGTPPPDAQLN